MKYLKLIIGLFVFFSGLTVGVVLKDLPGIRLNTEIRLFEPLTFLLTASIGLLIPFFIKRLIEDSRQIKNIIIDELKLTLKEYEQIKDKIKICYWKKSISSAEKEEINALFEQSDLKLNCLMNLMISAYNSETSTLRDEIKGLCIEYWKFTTCAEIMSISYNVISDSFFRQHNMCFANFETKVKNAIINIHKL